jgi:hypothetical protein
MLKEVDGAYIAAQIRLLRQVQKGTILILEGETDAKALDSFIDGSTCEIEIAFGKPNVLEALDLLEDEGFPGVVGVVDADFDQLSGTTHSLDNLCVTDVHDLDMMIFKSSAFDKYVAEHGNEDRIATGFQGDSSTVRLKIIECCLPLAYCRLASERRNLRLRFAGLKHEDLVDVDALTMDRGALIATVISRSNTNCAGATLSQFLEYEEARLHDPYQLTNGHDVAAVLGIALRKLIGERRDVHTWASEIEAGLRLAFDWEALTGTGLYQCLRAWEQANTPYRIFRR